MFHMFFCETKPFPLIANCNGAGPCGWTRVARDRQAARHLIASVESSRDTIRNEATRRLPWFEFAG